MLLHCYDRWEANEAEVKRAARAGVVLSLDQDTLPVTRKSLEPFGVPVQFHKGDIRDARWDDGPISVYVDDASKMPKLFYHALVTFGPSWILGQTVVVLMDYNFWKDSGDTRHKCQTQFVEANCDCFEPIEWTSADPTSACAAFLYTAPIHFQKWVVATLTGSLASAEREVWRRNQEIHALRNSTSWRITAPLRCCADGLRGLV